MTDATLEEVYTFIQTYIRDHGYPPSIREIAEGCYIDPAYVMRCLDILQARGRLTREPGRARSIRLLKP